MGRVLSTTSGTPWAWAMAAIASRSATMPSGLETLSTNTRPGLVVDRGGEVLRARAGRRTSPASRTAGRCGSSGRSSRHRAWSSRRRCSPGRSRLRKVRNCAAWPEAVQQAAVPPSSAAIRASSTETVGLVRRRIDVAELLQVEQGCRMVDVVEHVGGGLVDRDRPGAGGRVGLGTGVDRQGLEAVGALGHVRWSLLRPDARARLAQGRCRVQPGLSRHGPRAESSGACSRSCMP